MTWGAWDKCSGGEAELNSRGFYLGQTWWEDHHVWERSAALVFIAACDKVKSGYCPGAPELCQWCKYSTEPAFNQLLRSYLQGRNARKYVFSDTNALVLALAVRGGHTCSSSCFGIIELLGCSAASCSYITTIITAPKSQKTLENVFLGLKKPQNLQSTHWTDLTWLISHPLPQRGMSGNMHPREKRRDLLVMQGYEAFHVSQWSGFKASSQK